MSTNRDSVIGKRASNRTTGHDGTVLDVKLDQTLASRNTRPTAQTSFNAAAHIAWTVRHALEVGNGNASRLGARKTPVE